MRKPTQRHDHGNIVHVHPVAQVATHTPTDSTTTIAIIPARYHSKRLPGKPLLNICGRPMIEHVYRRAQQAKKITGVIVATDDSRIADVVNGFGGNACLTRRDHSSGSDRLAEVARTLTCDIVVNVQGDEPLIDPRLIDAVLTSLIKNDETEITTARCAITDPQELENPNIVKVVVDRRGDALYFSRAAIPSSQMSSGTTRSSLGNKHIGLYAYRRATLLTLADISPTPLERDEQLEQLRALESGFRISTVETDTVPIGVDTVDDLDRVRRLVSTGTVK